MFDRGEKFELIGVREPHEYEIVKIEGSNLIPKDRILSGEALAELPQDRKNRQLRNELHKCSVATRVGRNFARN